MQSKESKGKEYEIRKNNNKSTIEWLEIRLSYMISYTEKRFRRFNFKNYLILMFDLILNPIVPIFWYESIK